MRKALLSAADVVIFDLEDAVSPDSKDEARANVMTLLSELTSSTAKRNGTVCVRVNCLKTSQWGMHDLRALAKVKVDAVLLPKVEDVSIVQTALDTLDDGALWELSSLPTSLWCMIETPRGVQRAQSIADMDGVGALVFGSNDLTKDLKARHTPSREPLLYSMSQCVLAARAAGKQVIDGVHLDITDMNGLVVSCEQGRSLGFDGKSLIHPNQIDPTNKGYSPSPEDVLFARRVVAAYESQGKGVIKLDNRLVEQLHVEQAKLLIADADDIERLEQSRRPA
jgi:citrate lyase subunit beta/citryl-CoA lyase